MKNRKYCRKSIISIALFSALILGLASSASAGVSYAYGEYTTVHVISTSSQGVCSAVTEYLNAEYTGATVSVYNSSGKRIGINSDAWEGINCSTSYEKSGIASAKGSSSVKIGSSYYTGASTTAYT